MRDFAKVDLRTRHHSRPVSQLSASSRYNLGEEPQVVRESLSSKQLLKPDARAAFEGAPRNIECWAIQNNSDSQPVSQPAQKEQIIPGTLKYFLKYFGYCLASLASNY